MKSAPSPRTQLIVALLCSLLLFAAIATAIAGCGTLGGQNLIAHAVAVLTAASAAIVSAFNDSLAAAAADGTISSADWQAALEAAKQAAIAYCLANGVNILTTFTTDALQAWVQATTKSAQDAAVAKYVAEGKTVAAPCLGVAQ